MSWFLILLLLYGHLDDDFLVLGLHHARGVGILRKEDGEHAGYYVEVGLGQAFKEDDVFLLVVTAVGRAAMVQGGVSHALVGGER